MQPFPKQSHDVKSPVLEQVCNSICGLQTKKSGYLWSNAAGFPNM